MTVFQRIRLGAFGIGLTIIAAVDIIGLYYYYTRP